MKFSVILPCYNGADTIAAQLDALTHQTWSEAWEVIVVNNGSTDDSMAMVESYRDRLPDLHIVQAYEPPAPRLGVSHSYNVGLRAATGDAIAFCEADDEVDPDWLNALGRGLQTYDCVTGSLDYTRLNEPWILEMHGAGAQSQELISVKFPPYLPFFYGCNLGFHRRVYEAIGAIDESYFCAWDMDYSFRLQIAGFSLGFVPDAIVHYRVRHEFGAIYRQSRRWGEEHPLIRKRYGSRMGKLEIPKRTLFLVGHLLRIVLVYQNRAKLAGWVFKLGWDVGELQGLFKHVVFPFFGARSQPSPSSGAVGVGDKSSP